MRTKEGNEIMSNLHRFGTMLETERIKTADGMGLLMAWLDQQEGRRR